MNIVADLHTHTLASSHAFSTLNEMIERAKKLGYKAMAVTDHGMAMPDSPHEWYFYNIVNIPSVLDDGFILLKGAEANVMDIEGHFDIDDETMQSLDWVIAALHAKCISPLSCEQATDMWLKVAQHPYVDMIGHCEEECWKFNYDRVIPVFKEQNKIIEINGNSPVARRGNEENMRELILCCKRHGAPVAVNSDAHSTHNMGRLGWVFNLLDQLEFPQELVINTSLQRLRKALDAHGRAAARLIPPGDE